MLRDDEARTLGFENYASMKMEEMMAHSADDVLKLLHEICHQLKPLAKAEDKRLQKLKVRDVNPKEETKAITLNDWDWSFYARNFRAQNRGVHGTKIEEFFEMDHTWTATCGLFEELFRIEFHDITGQTLAWHKSVRVYTVWDGPQRDGNFLGYLYADLLERDGKYPNQRHVLIEPVRAPKSVVCYARTQLIIYIHRALLHWTAHETTHRRRSCAVFPSPPHRNQHCWIYLMSEPSFTS